MNTQQTHLISFTCTATCEASYTSNQIKNSKDLISEIVDELLLIILKLDVDEQRSITFQCHPRQDKSVETNSNKNPVVQLVIYNIKKLDTVNQIVNNMLLLHQNKNGKFDVQVDDCR